MGELFTNEKSSPYLKNACLATPFFNILLTFCKKRLIFNKKSIFALFCEIFNNIVESIKKSMVQGKSLFIFCKNES